MSDRYVLLGLAGARSGWFARLSRWATEAVVPADFVKTLSAVELRARLDTGRPYSAVILDGAERDVDRDLLATIREAGCAAFVVTDHRRPRDWTDLGATATLDPDYNSDDLVRALAVYAKPIARIEAEGAHDVRSTDQPRWQCPVVTVTGVPGAGRSTVAMALAQGLARQAHQSPVALADFALEADLAMLHDVGDVVPGVQELVEAHRLGSPTADTVRGLLFPAADHGYDVLAGLRQPSDWPVLRRGSAEAALAGVRHAYRLVVVDTDADSVGEADVGSRDLEDRSAMSRVAIDAARVVVVVGRTGVQGLHRHLRLTARLTRGVGSSTVVVPLVNHAPQRGPARLEISRTFATLVEAEPQALAPPVFLRGSRQLEARLRDGRRLPSSLSDAVTEAVGRLLDQRAPSRPTADQPEPIMPGDLGHWSDDGEAA